MALITIEVLTAPEAAVILRAALGSIRSWGAFLADNIRGKQHIHELTLMPVGKKKIGRSWRPLYAREEIMRFVADVLAVEPTAGKARIAVFRVTIDTSKGWRENRV